MTIDHISDESFPKVRTGYPERKFITNSLGGSRNPRTWFKKFLRVWPEFKLNPVFTVNDAGNLQFACDAGTLQIRPSMLFPWLATDSNLVTGDTVKFEL